MSLYYLKKKEDWIYIDFMILSAQLFCITVSDVFVLSTTISKYYYAAEYLISS